MTPWQTMTSLLNNKEPTKEEKEKINSFLLLRWLSNDPNTVQMANYVNRFYNMPPLMQYQFCDDYLELSGIKNRVKFIYYQKEKIDKDYQTYIDSIQKKYNLNTQQAENYYKILPKTDLEKIKTTYENRD